MRPSDAYMHQKNRPSLFQIMACRLSAPNYHLKLCWLIVKGPLGTNFSEIRRKNKKIKKMILKMSFAKWRPFSLDLCVWFLFGLATVLIGLETHKVVSLISDVSHTLTDWKWVTHICVGKLCHRWFKIMACRFLVPSYYPKQFWPMISLTIRNKFHWNLNRNWTICIQEHVIENFAYQTAAIFDSR